MNPEDNSKKTKTGHLAAVLVVLLVVVGIYFYLPSKSYSESAVASSNFLAGDKILLPDFDFGVTHIKTPEQVKAIYMTSWVAGTSTLRDRVIALIDTTEVNAVVIDIKDATGKIAFLIDNEPFHSLGSSENRIPDVKDFIEKLHKKGIYVIGRVAVFQDPYLIKKWPEEAVKKKSDATKLWTDRKGLGWFDAGSQKVWDYVIAVARESYNVGFDEINFDYVRYPSDGNMQDIYFPLSDGAVKQDTLEKFFAYLDENLRKQDRPITTSADIFGMTTTNTDDLGIGQVLEKTLPYFDFVDPMVYPSHFPDGWSGMANPAERPYDVIHKSMAAAYARAEAMGEDTKKLRPWLQDFNLGAVYTADLVRAQIDATYDVGLDSWLMWDPKNIYTKGAFLSSGEEKLTDMPSNDIIEVQ